MLTYAPSILDLSSHLDLDLVSGFLSSFLAESDKWRSLFGFFKPDSSSAGIFFADGGSESGSKNY